MGFMTEQELRAIMASDKDTLPDDGLINGWAKATGLTKKRVRDIFGEVIGDPDPWGMPLGERG
jgi:hypothetical protein